MRSTYGAIEGSHPRGLADLLRRPRAATTRGPSTRSGSSGDVEPNPFKGPRRKPLPMPPMSPKSREHGILKPAALRLGLHPFDTPAPHQQRAPRRPLGLHAHPLVRRLRLRDGRQERHPQHRHPARARHRQRRAPHASAMVEEILVDAPRPRDGRRLLRRERPAAGAAGRPGRRFRRRHRVGAPAAPLEEPALPERPRQPLRLGGPQPARDTPTPAPSASSSRRPTTTSAPASASPSATTTTATPGSPAAACSPTSSSACPSSSRAPSRPGIPSLGQGAQGLHAALLPAQHRRRGPDAGHPDLGRAASQLDPHGEGLLGHPRGAPLRGPPPALDRDRRTTRRREPRSGSRRRARS